MRRWISFGLIVLVACVAAANLASPGAWASDSHAPYMTVPTRTPKPRNTPVPPEKGKDPTNTPASAPTNTPVVANPTRTATATQPAKTATAAPRVTSTSTTPAGTVQPASTSTATPLEQATATAAGPVETATPTGPVETAPATTSESASVATVLSTPTIDGGANAAPAAGQPDSSASGSGAPGLWLLVVAVALMIFGGVLFFGRRAKDSDK